MRRVRTGCLRGVALALLMSWGSLALRGDDEFVLVDSSFSPVDGASGGEFDVALQPTAGAIAVEMLAGGDFSIEAAAVEPLPPSLDLIPNLGLEFPGDGSVRVTWGADAVGWILESSTDLRNWQGDGTGVALGAPGSRTAATSRTAQFYRLRR